MRVISPRYPELLLQLSSGRVTFNGGRAQVSDSALQKEVREYVSRGLGVGADIVVLDDLPMDDLPMDDPALDEAKPRTGQKKS